MSAHVKVWRFLLHTHPAQVRPWSWMCDDADCRTHWSQSGSDHDTHAEALAAAIQHCETYPRKDQP